jgi:predicted AAA+ superfamily ATPase
MRTGQILNSSELAREIGMSVPTIKRWLSLLETGYQVYLSYPYYKNIGKRLVKSPKLYFADTGLACYLLGIRSQHELLNSHYFPRLFETYIVTDFWKRFLHFGQMPSLYYLKTRDGLEIDMAIEANGRLNLFEIKSSATITPHHASSLIRASKDLHNIVQSANIISCGPDVFSIQKNIKNLPWQTILVL